MPDHLTAKDLETIREDLDHARKFDNGEARVDAAALSRLVAFAEKQPVTKDGVYTSGSLVYHPDGQTFSARSPDWWVYPISGIGTRSMIHLCYSTPQAAAAAREGRE